MKITEKTINKRGQSVQVVQMIPGGIERGLRLKSGLAGLLLIGLAVALSTFIPEFQGSYRVKTIILGVIFGGSLLFSAIGRRVFRSEDRLSIRAGTRFCGITIWFPCVPMTKDQVLEVCRNKNAELVVRVKDSEEGNTLMAVGPFVDGDQAVEAISLLRPRKLSDDEIVENPQSVAVSVIRELERGVPKPLLRLLMLAVFGGLCYLAWFDRTWIDAGLSMLIGIPILILALLWFAPGSGVIYSSDDGRTVEFWTRHRVFHRLEYRKCLVTNEAPEFIRRKIHWATYGWLLLIPIYLGGVAYWILKLNPSLMG